MVTSTAKVSRYSFSFKLDSWTFLKIFKDKVAFSTNNLQFTNSFHGFFYKSDTLKQFISFVYWKYYNYDLHNSYYLQNVSYMWSLVLFYIYPYSNIIYPSILTIWEFYSCMIVLNVVTMGNPILKTTDCGHIIYPSHLLHRSAIHNHCSTSFTTFTYLELFRWLLIFICIFL